MSDVIDLGRFGNTPPGVTIDGSRSWHGQTVMWDEYDLSWERRHTEGRRCPGPGHGEPECGKMITDTAPRCKRCSCLHKELERKLFPIRERPRTEVDPLEYIERIRGEIAARKAAAYG